MSQLLEDVHDDEDTGEDGSEQARQLKYVIQSKMKQSPSQDKEDNVKLVSLQNYIEELSEQNEILIQAVEDLENDYTERVALFDAKLKNTEFFLKEKANRCEHLQLKIENYEAQRKEREAHLKALQDDCAKIKDENIQLQHHVNNLEEDLYQLGDLVNKARLTSKLQVGCVKLKSISLDSFFGADLVVSSINKGVTSKQSEKDIQNMVSQLKARDNTIVALEKDLEHKSDQYKMIFSSYSHKGEIVDSVKDDLGYMERQQKYDTNALAEDEIHIKQMDLQIEVYKKQIDDLRENLDKQKKEENKLQTENDGLKNALELRLQDIRNKEESIEILESQLKSKPFVNAEDTLNWQNRIKILEDQNKSNLEKLTMKEKEIFERDKEINQLKLAVDMNKSKMEQFKDEAREIVLKLNTAERAHEQVGHKALMKDEQLVELSNEVELLNNEKGNLQEQVLSYTKNIKTLEEHLEKMKQSLEENESKVLEKQELLQKHEQRTIALQRQIESLHQVNQDDYATHERKIRVLQEEAEIANQRYADINDELASVEAQLSKLEIKYTESYRNVNQYQLQLKELQEEKQILEMNLILTGEKHKTAANESFEKGKVILNLQGELNVTQKEFEGAVEELAQKSEESNQLYQSLKVLNEKLQRHENEKVDFLKQKNSYEETLKSFQEHISKTNQSYQEKITELQISSVESRKRIKNYEDSYNKLKSEVLSLNENNTMLSQQLEEVTNMRQTAVLQLEKIREQFQEFTIEKEQEVAELTLKISKLENEVHLHELNKLTLKEDNKSIEEQKQKFEFQLQEALQSSELLKSNANELVAKIKSLEEDVSSKSNLIKQQENILNSNRIQIDKSLVKIESLKEEIEKGEKVINNSKSRNRHCEEVISDLREKLAIVIKDKEKEKQETLKLQKHCHTLNEKNKEKLKNTEELNLEYSQKCATLKEVIDKNHIDIEKLKSKMVNISDDLNLTKQEKKQAAEQVKIWEGRFQQLKDSLEKDNLSLLEENCVLKQQRKDNNEEIALLKDDNHLKEEQISIIEKKTIELEESLQLTEKKLQHTKEEHHTSEEIINEMHLQLQHVLDEKKTLTSKTSLQGMQINQLENKINKTKEQLKGTAQQLTHYQEKINLCENNLQEAQEQLSTQKQEVAKMEKIKRKLQKELKRSNENIQSKDIQIIECNEVLNQMRQECSNIKTKYEELLDENSALQNSTMNYEKQLDEAHRQIEQLSIQVENQSSQLNMSKNKASVAERKLENEIHQHKSTCEEVESLKNSIIDLSEKHGELEAKFSEKEGSCNQLHQEMESCLQRNKANLEKIASKDAEIRLMKAELHSLQKKTSHMQKQIQQKSDLLGKKEDVLKQLKETSKIMQEKISAYEKDKETTTIDLSNIKASFKESSIQFTHQSKELAILKSELIATQTTLTNTEQQVAVLDGKNQKLKSELKRSLERSKNAATEHSELSKDLAEAKDKILRLNEAQSHHGNDLIDKEERILALKTNLSCTEERLKLKEEENEHLKNENLRISQNYHCALDQLNCAKQDLDSVKANGDRLTKESELVIRNMNTWVKEQREENEKISSKLRKLTEENKQMKKQMLMCKKEEKKESNDRFKEQLMHSSQQELSLRDLQAKVCNLEKNLDQQRALNRTNAHHYQENARSNIETIQQLHMQLSNLNHENLRQRALLAQQASSRKHETDAFQEHIGRPDSVSSILTKNIRASSSISNNHTIDKKYWIEKVGQLSEQLTESGQYWTEQLHNV